MLKPCCFGKPKVYRVRKTGSFRKGVLSESSFSRDSREVRDFRVTRDSSSEKTLKDPFRNDLFFLEITEMIEQVPRKNYLFRILVAPSTGWMLYYLCFSPTAIGPPICDRECDWEAPNSHPNTGGSPQPPRSKPLWGLNRAIVVL